VADFLAGRYLLILIAAFGALISQLLMKQGLNQGGPIMGGGIGLFVTLIQRILTTPILFLGYVLAFVSGLIWLVVISRLNLSYAVPMMTGTYFVLLLFSTAVVLREVVPVWHWIGALLIVAGIFLISRSG
jgi:drug/metabolite transporter (DMT)-like permease